MMSDPWQPNPNFAVPGAAIPGVHPPQMTRRTSAAAIMSLILGLLSVPTCCCALVSVPFSIAAIVTGHVGLGSVRRSAGEVTGQGLAISGLVLGYSMLVLAVGSVVVGFLLPKSDSHSTAAPSTSRSRLNEAELAVFGDSGGVFHGNNHTAKAMAEEYARIMEELDKISFTESGAKFKLSGGHYLTWCEFEPGRCAFVVHVPEYRRFEADAKEHLAKLAWITAHGIAREHLQPGDKLAVGLRGTFLYGSVMVGKVTDDDPEAAIEYQGDDADRLLPFFEPDQPPESDEDKPLDAELESPSADEN